MIWSTEHDLILHIKQNPDQRIGLLGPAGTSSDHAITCMTKEHFPDNLGKVLVDDFDKLYECLKQGHIDIAMIPAAYDMATVFFWAVDFQLIGSLVERTPDYHLCKKPGTKNIRRIASCDAVRHMITRDFSNHITEPYQLVIASSTADAANMLAEGKVEGCITNDHWRTKKELEVISTLKGVDMVWLFFRKKK